MGFWIIVENKTLSLTQVNDTYTSCMFLFSEVIFMKQHHFYDFFKACVQSAEVKSYIML